MITDISYVSVAVRNIDTAIKDFNRIYGLQEVTPITYSRSFGWLRVILGNGPEAFLELLQPTDEKLPLARFVERNGESIYLFSFKVDDLAATVRHLRARNVRFASWPEGARPERIRSVWIHPRATTGIYVELTEHLLENELSGFGGGNLSGETLLRELSYLAAVVPEIESAARLYQDILGLEITGPRNTEATHKFDRVVLGAGGRGFLELMQPNDSSTPMGRFLASRGPGPYMACFLTEDVDRTVQLINQRGGNATRDPQYGAWLHPKPNHGLFMQLSTDYLGRSGG
ncbi:MAG: VOC family protein [Chloroflexi bacterium]|nr:VOC family protein [Chloroflexota bacterium]